MDDTRLRSLYRAALEARRAPAGGTVTPEELDALASGRLPDEEASVLLDRVTADHDLLREYELLRAIHAAGGRVGRRVARARLAKAASVILLAGSALVWGTLRWTDPAPTVRGPGAIELLEPAADGFLAGPVTLVWSSVPNAIRYRVEVVDGSGVEVWTGQTGDTTLAVETGALSPGTAYAWWVEAVGPGVTERSALGRFEFSAP